VVAGVTVEHTTEQSAGEKGRSARNLSVRYAKRESLANHVILQIFALLPTRRSSARAYYSTPDRPHFALTRPTSAATDHRYPAHTLRRPRWTACTAESRPKKGAPGLVAPWRPSEPA
jgi:hypothetical protein